MNTLYDFHKGVKVLWDLRDGQYVEGEVKWITSAGNVGVQWQDEPEGTVYNYHYSDGHLSTLKECKKESSTLVKNTEINKNSIEDKLMDLIIHLIAVDQTDRACEVIEILKKYKHEITCKEYIKKCT